MKGIEISKKYFYEFGLPLLEKDFPDLVPRLSAGLAGEGSECMGYDDEISRDHDFEPGFCIWLSDDDYDEYGFRLSRAYMKLPSEFNGLKRQTLNPAGGARHGVFKTSEFFEKYLGSPSGPKTYEEWLAIPPQYLKTAVSGEIFVNNEKNFYEGRKKLANGYPEDVRLKKIAANSAVAGQAGQYNYPRLISRGETGGAQLAVYEFVRHVISAVYLVNNEYEPFYKWAYRGMRDLKTLSDLETPLSFLTETGNGKEEAALKCEIIEDVASRLIAEYKKQNISDATCNNLDTHALSVQEHVKDASLRNSNVFSGI